MTFNKENCFEMDGLLIEKQYAFPPNFKELQESLMLHWDKERKQWGLSLWNGWHSSLDKNDSAYGWECGWYFDRESLEEVMDFIKRLDESIKEREEEGI